MAHTQVIPTACHSEGLADILERVLDKGVVIAGDIKIKLCDIELLSIQIRLLIASVDKAREMGLTWWWQPPQQQQPPAALCRGPPTASRPSSGAKPSADRLRSRSGEAASEHSVREHILTDTTETNRKDTAMAKVQKDRTTTPAAR